MYRLLPQTGQARGAAADHRGNEDRLLFAHATGRALRGRDGVVAQPAGEVPHHRMQLRGAALIALDNTLQLLRQIQTVAGDDQHIGYLL